MSQGIRIAAEAKVSESVPSQSTGHPRVLSAPIQTEQENLAWHSGSWESPWEAQVLPFTTGALVSPVPGSPAGASQRGELARGYGQRGERGRQVSCEHLATCQPVGPEVSEGSGVPGTEVAVRTHADAWGKNREDLSWGWLGLGIRVEGPLPEVPPPLSFSFLPLRLAAPLPFCCVLASTG